MNTIKKFLHICCLIALATSPALANNKSSIELSLDRWVKKFTTADDVDDIKKVRSDFNVLPFKVKTAIYTAMSTQYNKNNKYDIAVRKLLFPGSRTDEQLLTYASTIKSSKEGKTLLDEWIKKFATAQNVAEIKDYRSDFNNLSIVEKTAINMAMAKHYNNDTEDDKAVRALLFPGSRTDEQLYEYASKIRTSPTPLTVPSEEEDSNEAPAAQNPAHTFNSSVGGKLLDLFVTHGGSLNATLQNSTIMNLLISVVKLPNAQATIKGYLKSPLLTADQKEFLSTVANDTKIFNAFKSVLTNEEMKNSLKTLTTQANIEKAKAIDNADGKVTAEETKFLRALFTNNKETIKTLAPMLGLSEDQINQLNSFDGNVEDLGFLPTSQTDSQALQPKIAPTATVNQGSAGKLKPIKPERPGVASGVSVVQETPKDISRLIAEVTVLISQGKFDKAAPILDGIREDTLLNYANDNPEGAQVLLDRIDALISSMSQPEAESGEPMDTPRPDIGASTDNLNGAIQTGASAVQSGSYDSGCYNF